MHVSVIDLKGEELNQDNEVGIRVCMHVMYVCTSSLLCMYVCMYVWKKGLIGEVEIPLADLAEKDTLSDSYSIMDTFAAEMDGRQKKVAQRLLSFCMYVFTEHRRFHLCQQDLSICMYV
jgi:hypothetical protein